MIRFCISAPTHAWPTSDGALVCVRARAHQQSEREGSSLLLAGLNFGLCCALDSLSLALDLLCHLTGHLRRLLDDFVLLKYIV